jgi:hypothetical protein
MSWPPDIICAACIIPAAVNVIRLIPNSDGYGAWIPSIVRSGAVIARIRAVISFTAYHTQHGESQSEPENKRFDFHTH